MGTNMAMIGIVPEELTEDNYEYWKVCLKNYLVSQGVWDVVSGKFGKPKQKHSPEYEEWRKKNALALHAIQLSCGSGLYAKFTKETHISAKHAWDHLAEKKHLHAQQSTLPDHDDETLTDTNGVRTEHHLYEALYRAVENNDWHEMENFLDRHPHAVRERISSHNDTALHIAIFAGNTKIAEELVNRMEPEYLELVNDFGATSLSLAIIGGERKLVKEMVDKNPKLLGICDTKHDDGMLPVIVASMYGRKNMVRYLYSVTPREEFNPERGSNGATLLNSLITAEIYDVASKLLISYPMLGVTEDHYGEYTIRILAQKPSAFPSGDKLAVWEKLIYAFVKVHSSWDSHTLHDHHGRSDEGTTEIHVPIMDERYAHSYELNDDETHNLHQAPSIAGNIADRVLKLSYHLGWVILRALVPDVKHIHDRKLVHAEALKLLSDIFKEVPKMSKSDLAKMDIDKAIYDAIKFGIVEFIEEILKYYPEIIWRKDNKGRTIFAHAIVLRQEKIFSLIHRFGTKKNITARRHDIFGNNFLHLAAKLSPPSQLGRVSGAALQMQRELQWYKEMESMVQPKLKEEVNEYNKTPSALFTEEHKDLAKEGERWMKSTAGSSMIVGTLIAAVMFTTSFTVPGGNNQQDGLPIMLEKQRHAFFVFMITNALSMFTSSTSILMFLGILTARYAEQDFLKSLPTKLIFGLACLFLSIVTMMVSFGASIYLILHKQSHWITLPIIAFSTIPIAIFSVLQFPLLIEMIYRTCAFEIFDKPNKRQPHRNASRFH